MREVRLDLGRVHEFAELAVQEKGRDYQYRDVHLPIEELRACVYFETDGSPSCIVGYILNYVGVSPEMFLDENLRFNEDGVKDLLAMGVFNCDRYTVEYLAVLQNHQDAGWTWGDALDAANAQFGFSEKEREEVSVGSSGR